MFRPLARLTTGYVPTNPCTDRGSWSDAIFIEQRPLSRRQQCLTSHFYRIISSGFNLRLGSRIQVFVKTIITIILSCIGDGCNLLRLINNSIIKLQSKLLIIPDKQMVAIAFRIAMIVSLTSIVAENRFCGLVRNQDSTTAIFEFVASAIIIPIIFEWLYSYKQSQNNADLKF